MALRSLCDYDIDPERGFVPGRDPLRALPQPYDTWDRVADLLPVLIMTRRVHAVLADMPVIEATGLTTLDEQRRALLLLAAFANTWMTAQPTPASIPASISVPLIAVAHALDRPPITTHATIVLGNWKRIDPSKPVSADNIDALVTFRGSIDEKWFFLSTVGVELTGAPALDRLVAALAAAQARDDARLADELTAIATLVARMTSAFLRVRECCDPHIFYTHVRPYIASWPATGVVYEGTGVGPVTYAGGSAAQSSLLQAVDAALGIAHTHALTREFLMSMRKYMPVPHRQFIEDVAAQSQVRHRVLRADAPVSLRTAYDAAIGAMDELRRKHIGLVSEYITKQMPQGASAIGTGGTSFDDFLRQSRIETVQAKSAQTRTAQARTGAEP